MNEKDRELYEIIGSILREAREKRRLTNVQVSGLLKKKGYKISDTSLRRYESGEHRINVEALGELCEIYDLNSTEVMKEAQIRRLQAYGEKLHVIRETDPDPIYAIYGKDASEILKLYLSLNDQGKAQAKTLLQSLTYNPDLTRPDHKEKED